LNQTRHDEETLETIENGESGAADTAVVSQPVRGDEDVTIADLAVGLNTGQIRPGSLSRTTAPSYNRLLGSKEELGDAAQYPEAARSLRERRSVKARSQPAT